MNNIIKSNCFKISLNVNFPNCSVEKKTKCVCGKNKVEKDIRQIVICNMQKTEILVVKRHRFICGMLLKSFFFTKMTCPRPHFSYYIRKNHTSFMFVCFCLSFRKKHFSK